MKINLLILLAATLLAVSPVAAATIQIDLDFTTSNLEPGQTVSFSGTISNLDTFVVYLNNCQVNLSGISVSGDCSDFLINAPLTLDPLQSGIPSFPMFTVTAALPYLDAYGLQNGSFEVFGGAEGSDLNLLGSAEFSVEVQVPEPASSLLVLSACVLLMAPSVRKLAIRPRSDR